MSKPRTTDGRLCEVLECGRVSGRQKRCSMHASRLWRLGSTDTPFNKRPMEQRFRDKYIQGGFDECWIWTAAHVRNGYGRFDNKPAARVAWELAYGIIIPDGLLACHSCDNPPCVNPRHIFLGDSQTNHDDMVIKGRRGRPHPPPKLSTDDIRAIKAAYTGRRGEQTEFAAQYGVSSTLIHMIVTQGHRSGEL